MLTRVWNEIDYRIDICHISKDDISVNHVKNLGEFISILV
jgi:hypothetical protein